MRDSDLYINEVGLCVSGGDNRWVEHEKGWMDGSITVHMAGEGCTLIQSVRLFLDADSMWDEFIPILEQWR